MSGCLSEHVIPNTLFSYLRKKTDLTMVQIQLQVHTWKALDCADVLKK